MCFRKKGFAEYTLQNMFSYFLVCIWLQRRGIRFDHLMVSLLEDEGSSQNG